MSDIEFSVNNSSVLNQNISETLIVINDNNILENVDLENKTFITKFKSVIINKKFLIKSLLFIGTIVQIVLLSLYKPLEESLLVCIQESEKCVGEPDNCIVQITCDANTYDANMAFNIGTTISLASYFIFGTYNPFSCLCLLFQFASSIAAFIINLIAGYYVPKTPLQLITLLWAIASIIISFIIIFNLVVYYRSNQNNSINQNNDQETEDPENNDQNLQTQIVKENFTEKVTIDKENIEDNCSICLSKLISLPLLKIKSCNHIFHKSCLQIYLEKHQGTKCPLCRISVN
jgi:hypothetical protein